MKCAKSLKTKYSASASGSAGTGEVPACRAASSATIRGDADPTWWTCSSAFGRPAMKAVRAGSVIPPHSDRPVSSCLPPLVGPPQDGADRAPADRAQLVHHLDEQPEALQCVQCCLSTIRISRLVELDAEESGADRAGERGRLDEQRQRAADEQPAHGRLELGVPTVEAAPRRCREGWVPLRPGQQLGHHPHVAALALLFVQRPADRQQLGEAPRPGDALPVARGALLDRAAGGDVHQARQRPEVIEDQRLVLAGPIGHDPRRQAGHTLAPQRLHRGPFEPLSGGAAALAGRHRRRPATATRPTPSAAPSRRPSAAAGSPTSMTANGAVGALTRRPMTSPTPPPTAAAAIAVRAVIRRIRRPPGPRYHRESPARKASAVLPPDTSRPAVPAAGGTCAHRPRAHIASALTTPSRAPTYTPATAPKPMPMASGGPAS